MTVATWRHPAFSLTRMEARLEHQIRLYSRTKPWSRMRRALYCFSFVARPRSRSAGTVASSTDLASPFSRGQKIASPVPVPVPEPLDAYQFLATIDAESSRV